MIERPFAVGIETATGVPFTLGYTPSTDEFLFEIDGKLARLTGAEMVTIISPFRRAIFDDYAGDIIG